MSYQDAKPDSFTELKEEAMNMLEDEAFPKIIAVDFDGTLCENQYPEIGEANETMISHIKLEKFRGSKIILWTCRNGKLLEDAVKWCEERCLEFDAVNENLPYIIEQFGGDTRKIFANEYIDDRNVMFFDASCPKCGMAIQPCYEYCPRCGNRLAKEEGNYVKRLTKRYPNGFITIDATHFPQTQEVIDCEIKNCEFMQAVLEKLYEHEERNPTRFSDRDVERASIRLGAAFDEAADIINNFDQGHGDIDDVVDTIENSEDY